MRPLFLLWLRLLRAHPKTYLKKAALYLLCSAFIIGEGMLLYSFLCTQKEKRAMLYGEQDFLIAAENEQTLQTIRQTYPNCMAGSLTVLAYGSTTEKLSARRLVIGTADAAARDIQHIRLTAGILPETGAQIAVEESLLSLLYPDADLGQAISLTLFAQDEQTMDKTFTLCGILADTSSNQSQSDTAPLPNALVADSFAKEGNLSPLYRLYALTFAGNTTPTLAEIENLPGVVSVQPNDGATLSAALGLNEGAFVYLSAIAMGAAAVFFIVCIFTTEKKDRSEQIGHLKLGGLTVADLKRYYLWSIFAELLPASLVGAGLGYFAVRWFLERDAAPFAFFFQPAVLLLLWCLSVLPVFLLLYGSCLGEMKASVLQNLLYYNEVAPSTAKKSGYTSNNPVLLYAIKSYQLNGESAGSAAVMVFLSLILFGCGLFCAAAFRQRSAQIMPADYTLVCSSGFYDSTGTIAMDPYYGISDSDVSLLENHPQVQTIAAIKRLYCFSHEGSNPVPFTAEERQTFGFTQQESLTPRLIMGVNPSFLTRLAALPHEGNLTSEALSTGTAVLYTYDSRSETPTWKAGDTIVLTAVLPENGSWRRQDLTVTVAACLDTASLSENSMDALAIGELMWSSESFSALQMPIDSSFLYLSVKNPDATEEMEGLLANLSDWYQNEGKHLDVRQNLQERQQLETLANSLSLLSAIGATALAVFSLFAMALHSNLKVNQRRSLWGFLRAVGLQKGDFRRILLLETLLEVGIPLLLGTGAALGICVLLNRTFFSVGYGSLPFTALMLFDLIYLALAAFAGQLPVHRLYHMPVAVTIREQE